MRKYVGRSTLVGQCPRKSLSSVCPSVFPSVRPSVPPSVTKFSQDCIISFFWYCTWRNLVFWHFLKFGSLVFLEIAYIDSLQQCLTCSRGKIQEEIFVGAKMGPETSFFCHFLRLGSLIFLEIACNDSLQQCLTSNRGKIHNKSFWCPNLG